MCNAYNRKEGSLIMGYESRIIVARRTVWEGSGLVWFEKLSEMWLSKVGYDFPEIFTTEIESNIYGDGFKENSDEEYELTVDKYGDICKYADVQTVIDWLDNAEAKEHYRRFTPAIAMLKAYAAEKWKGDIVVIHYGY
jgi:hypothetical protein